MFGGALSTRVAHGAASTSLSDPSLSPDEHLARLARLEPAERRRQAAVLAHCYRGDPALDALLDALEAGDLEERRLALSMAMVAGDHERASRALQGESASLALQAARLGAVADAETLANVLPTLAPRVARRLLGHVAARRRTAVAEHLIRDVRRDWGAAAAAHLLPICTEATVRRLLPRLDPAVRGWRRLAAAHPDPVLEALRTELADRPDRDGPWVRRATALGGLARQRPAGLLDLAFERLAAGRELPAVLDPALGALLRRAPQRTALLLLHPAERARLLRRGLPRAVLRPLRRLPAAALRELARALAERPHHLAVLLEALPPGCRSRLFHHAYEGVDTRRHRWPDALLAALPRPSLADAAERQPSAGRQDPGRPRTLAGPRQPGPVRPGNDAASSTGHAAASAQAPAGEAPLRSTLGDRAADRGWPLAARVAAVRALGRSPDLEVDDLAPLLAAEDGPIVAAALVALGGVDRPRGALPVLTRHLAGDHASAAVSGLARVARRLPAPHLLDTLKALLERQDLPSVVCREALCLLGTMPCQGHASLLVDAWRRHRSGADRDVRIAFGRAARRLLDWPDAWTVLVDLAADADTRVTRSLLDATPAEMIPEERQRWMELLLWIVSRRSRPREAARNAARNGARAMARDEAELRRDTFRTLAVGSDSAPAAAARRVADSAAASILDLGDPIGWKGALDALMATVPGPGEAQLVPLAAALRTAPVPPSHDAGTERDLPARRRLHRLLVRLLLQPRSVRRQLDGVLRELAAELGRDGSWWSERARLRLALIEWSRPSTAAAALAELLAEVEGEPFLAASLVRSVGQVLDGEAGSWDAHGAEALLRDLDRLCLAAAAARHLELAVLQATARRYGWEEPRSGRLRRLRAHPNDAVSAAALAVDTRRRRADVTEFSTAASLR